MYFSGRKKYINCRKVVITIYYVVYFVNKTKDVQRCPMLTVDIM